MKVTLPKTAPMIGPVCGFPRGLCGESVGASDGDVEFEVEFTCEGVVDPGAGGELLGGMRKSSERPAESKPPGGVVMTAPPEALYRQVSSRFWTVTSV